MRSTGLESALVAALVAGCTGQVLGSADQASGAATVGAPDPGAAPGGGRGAPVPSAAIDPGPAPLRLLTHLQLDNAVRRLFSTPAARPSALLPDETERDGFTNQAAAQLPSTPLIEGYATAAAQLAAQAVADTRGRAALVPCAPAQPADQACLRSFVQAFATRAYRRPLTDEEVQDLVGVGATEATRAGDFFQGVRTVLEIVLQAPSFLYRLEVGKPNRERPELLQLDGWSMASRLSFLLWNEPPDDALLDLARRDQLATRAQVEQQAARLLADARARPAARDFFGQWLLLASVPGLAKDRVKFPAWNDRLAASMVDETARLTEDLAFGGGDFLELFDAATSFVDANLAKLYGMAIPAGAAPGKVTLPPERRGIVGHASFLAASSHPTSTSPTRRGLRVREQLLCQPVPSPPADVNATLPEPSANVPQTVRQLLEAHRQPACAACHAFIDGVGLGLESFDAIGAYRRSDAGAPIDDAGELTGAAPGTFHGAAGLAALLRASSDAGPCVVRQLYRWSLGRAESASGADDTALRALAGAFDGTGRRFTSLLNALVTSDLFRFIDR